MTDEHDDLPALRRVAIIGVVLAVIFNAAVLGVGLVAAHGDLEGLVVGNPDTFLGSGAETAYLWRLAMLADMFGSYLLLLPLALYLHRRLRVNQAWLADIGMAGAVAYIFLGAASAAILASAGSSLIGAYETAASTEQTAIKTSFVLLRDTFYFGIWQMLDGITAGTWVFSTGWLLLPSRPILGRLLVPLGAGFWAGSLMTMLDVHSLAVWGGIFVGALLAWLALILVARPASRMSA